MDQLNRSNKHRGEVIEIYDNGMTAAVRFTSGRIECVKHNGTAGNPDKSQHAFEMGQKGMVDYVRGLNGWHWVFSPFKYEAKEK